MHYDFFINEFILHQDKFRKDINDINEKLILYRKKENGMNI